LSVTLALIVKLVFGGILVGGNFAITGGEYVSDAYAVNENYQTKLPKR
jgi:hypothetical protein